MSRFSDSEPGQEPLGIFECEARKKYLSELTPNPRDGSK